MSWAAQAHPAEAEDSIMDSMLAETGYAIPQSHLPDLADRIQLLDNLVSATEIADFLPDSSFFSNPSDISSWINTLIKGGTSARNSLSITDNHDPPSFPAPPGIDAPGNAAAPPTILHCSPSLKDGNGNSTAATAGVPSMLHLIEDEDEQSGVKLIHLLLACASCIQQPEQLRSAEAIMNEIRVLLLSMGERAGAMGRVALYFAQGLEQRLLQQAFSQGSISGDNTNIIPNMLDEDPGFLEMLHLQFYHTCPYLKFGHFTANQAMLEELEGEKAVHIVDLDLGLGLQWPPLIHMLAIRPGGAPLIRFTAVSDDPIVQLQLQQTGVRLTRLASSVNVELRFHMADSIKSVQLQAGEAVAVNSMLHLHRLLYDAGVVTSVLATIRRLNPKIFTVVEQEADHNNDSFQNRFFDALHYYSSVFDAIDAGCKLQPSPQEEGVMASEAYLGREIRNIVACEGKARVERHERLDQWRQRMFNMGFRPRNLGSNAYNQAATLLTIFPGGGHVIFETAGCLTLGWHTRPLVAASAWRCC